MTCKKCGSALPEGAIFCPDCGEKAVAEQQTTEPVVTPVEPVQAPAVTTVAEAKSPLHIFAGIGFGLVTLMSLIWLFRGFRYGVDIYEFINLLEVVGGAMITTALFMNKKFELIPIGGLAIALSEVITFIYGFFWGRYMIDYSYLSDSFNPLTLLPSLLYIAAAVVFAGYVAAFVLEQGVSFRKSLKALWFVPAVLFALATILQAILSSALYSWNGAYNPFYFENIVYMVGIVAGYIVTGLYISKRDEMPADPAAVVAGTTTDENAQAAYTAPQATAAPQAVPQTKIYENGYCEMLKHILLLFFTFGIWNYIWVYKTTEYLNCVEGEEQKNPTTQLLLCMFVPFYLIYWTYVYAKRIDRLAAQKGVESDITIICLLFAIFFYYLAPIFMQDKLNNIVRPVARPVYVQTAPASAQETVVVAPAPATPAPAVVVEVKAPAQEPVAAAPAASNVVEELKGYKELLDSGIITQEEFDAKKAQLLNL